ncbi:MAG: hypothetical protein WKF37_03770 [Bryobacteraceae bacterium]
MSEDQPNVKAPLETESSPGVWTPLDEQAEVTSVPPPPNLRLAATQMLKRHGITHLAVDRNEFLFPELHKNTVAWGATALGEEGSVTLYRLD